MNEHYIFKVEIKTPYNTSILRPVNDILHNFMFFKCSLIMAMSKTKTIIPAYIIDCTLYTLQVWLSYLYL